MIIEDVVEATHSASSIQRQRQSIGRICKGRGRAMLDRYSLLDESPVFSAQLAHLYSANLSAAF